MTKAANTRQIETAGRELNRAIDSITDAWQQHCPYPDWEQEQEWRRANPSPRERHKLLERQVREAWRQEADALLLRIKMGEITSEDCYARLKEVLDRMQDQRLFYLKTL